MTKRPTCRVCRKRSLTRSYSIELWSNGDAGQLEADVETYLCQDCSERVADELLNVVMKVRADHLSEVKS